MTSRPTGDQLPPIRFEALAGALLGRAEVLVGQWLPGGKREGREYKCGSLSGGAGSSCSVNLDNGRWADFATDDQGGDLIALYAAIFSLEMGKAAVQLARELGLEDVAGVRRADGAAPAPPPPRPPPAPPTARKAEPEGWVTVLPVPKHAPEPTFRHHHRQAQDITHTATYTMDGHLQGYVVRFRTSDGGKETLPYTWCVSQRDGAARWTWRQFDEPRPLFFPAGVSPLGLYNAGQPPRTVVLVEGEKKAIALQGLLDAGAPGIYLVASWPGGCKAWKRANWDWLAGCVVLLWPDCDAKRVPLTQTVRKAIAAQVQQQLDDMGRQVTSGDRSRAVDAACQLALGQNPLLPAHKQPGMAAMLGIGHLLVAEHMGRVQLLPIPDPGAVLDGWDCDDAINTDGWDFARVVAFFGQAGALPPPSPDEAPAAASGGGGGGKKIDGLAGAPDPDGGESGDGSRMVGGKRIPAWLLPYWDSEKLRWYTSRKLVIRALEQDPALEPVLAYNELSNTICARVAWPWLHAKAGPISGSDDLLLGDYLTRTYGMPSISRAALVEAIETVAHARRYHPVREYLQALEHDGTPRIDKWLVYAMGESPDSIPRALYEYLCLVGRFWLLGMVNRVMEPGCKFDYCPVLEGPGGFGKSTLVEALASAEFFSDTHFDVSRGKEGQEQVQGLWLYEIAELANFGKAEIGLIKSFITGKIDRYRPSYGRVVEAYPRQCVLVGTTNESTYLRDRTGNRRFWPIPVRHRIRIAWVIKQRDQLLAEAYALYQAGAAFTPDHEVESRLFVPMQESRLVETAVLSELTHVLTRDPVAHGIGAVVNNLADFVTISQLTTALGVDAAKSNAGLEAQIRGYMDHEGWQRKKRQINGARAWGYERPDDWPPQEPATAPDNTPMATPGPSAIPSTHGDADDAPF